MIQVKEVNVYDLTVNGTSLGLFEIASEWEGLKKLEHLRTKEVLIVAPNSPERYSNFMDSLFSQIQGVPIIRDFNVIMASPNLALKIKQLGQTEEK